MKHNLLSFCSEERQGSKKKKLFKVNFHAEKYLPKALLDFDSSIRTVIPKGLKDTTIRVQESTDNNLVITTGSSTVQKG